MNICPDVIILYECWLNEKRINPKMSGYITLSTKKVINKSGGVTAYVRGVWSTSVREPLYDKCLKLTINDSFHKK